MPEGPEIRRAADKIGQVLEGEKALRVSFAFERLRHFEDQLEGQTIESVRSRGKAMLIRFENDMAIYSHNQLYGRWQTTKKDSPPSTRRQIRLSLATAKGTAWLLSASQIEVLDADGRKVHGYLSKLGLDPLDAKTTPARLVKSWHSAGRRSLAALFLDQGFLAGVGNYLRSEILFEAGLDPHGHLPADLKPLARTALKICRRAYEKNGVTTDLKGATRREGRHWVYARAGKPCRRCGTAVKREELAGRRLFYCPTCQDK